jgi:hypothetical protein
MQTNIFWPVLSSQSNGGNSQDMADTDSDRNITKDRNCSRCHAMLLSRNYSPDRIVRDDENHSLQASVTCGCCIFDYMQWHSCDEYWNRVERAGSASSTITLSRRRVSRFPFRRRCPCANPMSRESKILKNDSSFKLFTKSTAPTAPAPLLSGRAPTDWFPERI